MLRRSKSLLSSEQILILFYQKMCYTLLETKYQKGNLF